MTPERWQHSKHLVNSALEQSAEQSSAVLRQSCAEDVSLRRGAEALLSFHEQATRNLAAPAKFNSFGTMSPERWQQIEQLFQSALELQPAQSAAFLAKACGDDVELREVVEALLLFQNRHERRHSRRGSRSCWFAGQHERKSAICDGEQSKHPGGL